MSDKSKIVYFPDKAAVEAEAAAWVARFDGGPLSVEESVRFQEWVGRSAVHRDAIIQYGRLWSEFDQLRELVASAAPVPDVAPNVRCGGIPRRWLAAGLAASLIGFIVAGVAYRESAVRPPATLVYDTAIGIQKTINLSDGSTVTLNTNSRIAVEMSAKHRSVHLLRGEAYFKVAHDQQRPFSVYAGKGVVRDIGTTFDVRLLRDAVDVSVTAGSIMISTREPQAGSDVEKPLAVVNAGRAVVFSRSIVRSQEISDADMKRKLAWRQGVLIYAGDPLEKVADDINRYAGINVEIGDPRLRNRLVGGSFKIDQIDSVFVALHNNFGIRSEWLDSKHVRLSLLHGQRAPRD